MSSSARREIVTESSAHTAAIESETNDGTAARAKIAHSDALMKYVTCLAGGDVRKTVNHCASAGQPNTRTPTAMEAANDSAMAAAPPQRRRTISIGANRSRKGFKP